MSDYLDKEDSSDEEETVVCTLSDDQIAEVRAQCASIKVDANACFSAQDYDGAIVKYGVSYVYKRSSFSVVLNSRRFVWDVRCRKY